MANNEVQNGIDVVADVYGTWWWWWRW